MLTLATLTVIAQLCLTPNGADNGASFSLYDARNMQLSCQQYYVSCLKKNTRLEDCILALKWRGM